MSQHSSSQFSDFGSDPALVGPSRTSLLAIASLICSLVCFIPGLSVLGVALGLLALVLIPSAGGRVGGKGLAIAGVVLGLLFTFAWVGLVYGGVQMAKMVSGAMGTPVREGFAALEKGDYDGARAVLHPDVRAEVSDAELAVFVERYHQAVGTFDSVPEGLFEFFGAYGQIGQQMQKYQGGGNIVPIPAVFSNGTALVVLHFDQNGVGGGSGGPTFSGSVTDLIVVASDGTEISMM